MARSLEGQEFLYSYNGGVNALVDRQTWLGLNKADQILKAIWQHDPGSKVAINYLPTVTTPIFTFANHKRVQTSPWFTGHTEHLEKLYDHIRRHGGKLCSEYGNFYVPFSNGFGVMRNEHKFAVSHGDLIEWFGPNAGSSVL